MGLLSDVAGGGEGRALSGAGTSIPFKAGPGPPELAREEKESPGGQPRGERLGHYTARAWEADSGGEVGTEQMLEPKRVKSDGREAAERRTTNGHLEQLCSRLENPDRKYGPFCKKQHLFCGEKKGSN